MKHQTCPDCSKEFDKVTGCSHTFIIIDSNVYARIKHEGKAWCNNCLACPSKIHHFGCDKEVCPKDFSELMDCPCNVTGVIKAENISAAEQVFVEAAAVSPKGI